MLNPAPELHSEELEEGIGGGGAAGVDGGGDDDQLRVELLLAGEEEGAEPQLPLRRLGGHILQGWMEAMAGTCSQMKHITERSTDHRPNERPLGSWNN